MVHGIGLMKRRILMQCPAWTSSQPWPVLCLPQLLQYQSGQLTWGRGLGLSQIRPYCLRTADRDLPFLKYAPRALILTPKIHETGAHDTNNLSRLVKILGCAACDAQAALQYISASIVLAKQSWHLPLFADKLHILQVRRPSMRNDSSLLASSDCRATHNLSSRPSFRERQDLPTSASARALAQLESRDTGSTDLGSVNSSGVTGNLIHLRFCPSLDLALLKELVQWWAAF